MAHFSSSGGSGRTTVIAWLLTVATAAVVVDAQLDSSLVCVRPTDPRGIATHNDSLYVLDPGEGAVHRYHHVDGQYVGTLTTSTGTAGGGIKAEDGYLYVSPASETDSTVKKMDAENGGVDMEFPGASEPIEQVPPAAGGYDVAIDANGTVYVSNYVSPGVKTYNGSTGLYMGTILEDTNVLGVAFGPDDVLYVSVPDTDTIARYGRDPDGSNFTIIDMPISGPGGSRVREGAWGIHINQEEYLVYVVWTESREITEYTSDARELRYWGSGVLKTWWSSDPETSRGRESLTASVSSATESGNGTSLTPWYVATDSDGNIYVTASDESADGSGLDRDVFKYDGATGDVIGRFSDCFGEGYPRTNAPTPVPTLAPTTVAERGIYLTPSPTTNGTEETEDESDDTKDVKTESSGGVGRFVDRISGVMDRQVIFVGVLAMVSASFLLS